MPANRYDTFPHDLYYDRTTHTWVRNDGTVVTIGLDSLGLEALGDVAYLSLQAVGNAVKRAETIGSLEAAKMVGELIAPVSGTIVARNEAVLHDPGLINREPYSAGWLVQIMPSAWEHESGELVHGAELPGWIEAEVERYRSQGWID